MSYTEIKGDLITLAQTGLFDVIAHGCNCFCKMKSGIAPKMVEAFGVDNMPSEAMFRIGDINKLGQIETKTISYGTKNLVVINAYTQYDYNKPNIPQIQHLDYEALRLCLRKINHVFKGRSIGLPKIGAGKAKGDWETIKKIIQQELKDCHVTIVIFNE